MDDDSGAGLLIGLVIVIAAIYVVGLILAAIVIAVGAVIGTAVGLIVFFAVGAGVNLAVRHAIGLTAALTKNEESPSAARRGLVIVYGAPWFLLLLSTPLLINPLGLAVWFAGLLVSMPAYYWSWWNGHHERSMTALSESRGWQIEIPEFHLEVSWPMDATMQAEERILYARLQGRKLMAGYQTKVWMLEAKESVLDLWRK